VSDEAAASRICARAWRRDPGRRPWLSDDTLEPPMNPFMTALVAACGLAAATSASAHEFWLEPTAFAAQVGGHIGVYVCNGSGYEGWSLPRDPRRIEEFVAVGPEGSQPVVGLDGSQPAGLVRFTSPGGYVIAFRSNRAMTVQTDEKFDAYLEEKGLDAILARRNKEGHRGGQVRESYSRDAKALVQVSGAGGEEAGGKGAPGKQDASKKAAGSETSATLVDRALGLPLEIVAQKDLFTDGTEGTKTFRVLYLGKPLADALVFAMRPGTAEDPVTARTDRDGRAGFKLSTSGAWRIAAIHMVEPPKDVDADWDSLWASLTFELTPAASEATATTARTSVASAVTLRAPASFTRVAASPWPSDVRCQNQVATPAMQAQR